MGNSKRRLSQNNRLLRLIIERLREYELEEVIVICDKFRKRRNHPPLDDQTLERLLPPDSMMKLRRPKTPPPG